MVVVFLVLLAMGALGAVLAVLGWWGRRLDEHPVCGKCAFDLVGSPRPLSQCPECGAVLDLPGAVRLGNRARRPMLAMTGVGLVLPAAVLLIGAATLDVNAYKPLWLLRHEARATASAGAEAALAEIDARVVAGALDAAQMEALLEDVLTVQADASRPWLEEWGDLFWRLREQGIGTDAQHERFARDVIVFHAQARDRVRQGQNVLIPMSVGGHRGPSVNHLTRYSTERVTFRIGNHEVTYQLGGRARPVTTYTGMALTLSLAEPTFSELEPGEYTLHIVRRGRLSYDGSPGLGIDLDLEVVRPIEVFAAGESIISMVDDETMLQRVRDAMVVEEISRTGSSAYTCILRVRADENPLGLAFVAYAVVEGQRYELTKLVARAGMDILYGHFQWKDAFADGFTLVLEANEDAALSTINLDTILAGTIVFEDVLVDGPAPP